MQSSVTTRRLAWTKAVLAGLSLGACCAAAVPIPATTDDGSGIAKQYIGHTAPSEKRAQNFDLPGVVDQLLVKEGDAVKQGQLIAQQNTHADEAHLHALELLAKSELEVKAEEAQLAKDIVSRDRKEKLLAVHSIDPDQVEEARLAVVVDQLKIEHAREDKQKAAYDVAEQKARIEQKTMKAKIDGVISEISTHEGELANSDTQHPTVVIVNNEPLYVEVDLPTEVVTKMQLKQTLQVQYVDEVNTRNWRTASIRFIKPEADPTSNYEHVQLEMPNSEHRSSGLQITVKLPDNLAAASAPNGARANVTP